MQIIQKIKDLIFGQKSDDAINPFSISGVVPEPLAITAGLVNIGFSKNQGSGEIVLNAINQATKSIRLAAYGFNHPQIINALISAKQRGVDIKIVLDKSDETSKIGSAAVKSAGIPVRIDSHYAIMHNKFMILDEQSVETGSFNYTNNAQVHNAENVIFLMNQPAVAQKYTEFWQKLWDESSDF